MLGLASGLALALMPAGLAKVSRSTARRTTCSAEGKERRVVVKWWSGTCSMTTETEFVLVGATGFEPVTPRL
jgi:hypothetical protein